MADISYIDKDFVRFKFKNSKGEDENSILAFGDKVGVLEEGGSAVRSRSAGGR